MLVVGVDEVGRGCIAGPVYAAAVILRQEVIGLKDSKALSPLRREELAGEICNTSIYALGEASVNEIGALNIHIASLLAMQRAVLALSVTPEKALADGKFCPDLPCECESVVRGDTKIKEIMAASIVAKVKRDQYMHFLDSRYPGYDFARHKGYPTPKHIAALHRLGVSPAHRRTYAPVRALLEKMRSHSQQSRP